jgi:putative molybdopterin biosynthesis protein
MSKQIFTTKDVAEYLSINEKQVYHLIKEKKIPATRVTGKWLFPKDLIDEWLTASARENIGPRPARRPAHNQLVIAGSNDLALELLIDRITARHPSYTVSASNVGSLAGLMALQNGGCDVAASHLLDFETGQYNSTFIKKHFSGLKVTVLNLAYRDQGLIVQKDNPLGIKCLKDLAGKKAVFLNRQDGSGTRVLFDYKLRQEGIDPSDITGYNKTANTHMEVALSVFSGSSDVGMGIHASAKMLGLDFIPLATERFDLIIPNETFMTEPVEALREVLGSTEFKSTVARMVGYDTCDTGNVMYERD